MIPAPPSAAVDSTGPGPRPSLRRGRWLGEAVAVRFASIGLTAAMSIVSARLIGTAGFGAMAASLVTTGFLAPIGTAGLGRLALRDLPAGADGRTMIAYLRSRWPGLAGPVVALGAHVIILTALSIVAGRSGGSTIGLAVAGGVHTATVAAVTVGSDLLRIRGRDVLADVIGGRLGGGLSNLLALAAITTLALAGVGLDARWCLLALAGGGLVSIAAAVAAIAGGPTTATVTPDEPDGRPAAADGAAYAAALAVGPVVAATPIWLAAARLDPVEVGAIGLAAQASGAVGAVLLAVTNRQLAAMAGLFSGSRALDGVQETHDRTAPVLLIGVAATYGAVLVAATLAGSWLVPEAPGLFLAAVATFGGAQVWNAMMGMTGVQLQLSGHPGPVIAVGLGRAAATAATVMALPSTAGYLLAGVAGPALLGPWALNRLTTSLTGVRPGALRRTTIRRMAALARSR